MAAQAVMDEPE